MKTIRREVRTNYQGYKEVTSNYRKARAAAMETLRLGELGDRIACPMLDASRRSDAYGSMALLNTDSAGLKIWANTIEIDSLGIRIIAYLSGAPRDIFGNFLHGRFDDQHVNIGFIRSIKHGVNTGILAEGKFSASALSELIQALRPTLPVDQINQAWLYSKAADSFYLFETDVEKITDFNVARSKKSWMRTFLGRQMSGFEMSKLLLGVLAQEIEPNVASPGSRVRAILVRDVHDLYKYGFIPAHVEDRLASKGLISDSFRAVTKA